LQPQLHPAMSNIPVIPLPTLHDLRHFLQTTDKRNLAIAFLSVLVLFLSLSPAARRNSPLPTYRYTDELTMNGGDPTAGAVVAAAAASQQRRELVSPAIECVSGVASTHTTSTATTAITAETADARTTAEKKLCSHSDDSISSPDPPPEPLQADVDGGEGLCEQ
jgi:hypothetical protein